MDWRGTETCNVAGGLVEQATRQGKSTAIHYPDGISRFGTQRGRIQYRQCSYGELDELSDTYARGLKEFGIDRGMRAALMMPPGLDFFAMFFAMFKAGVVPVLIDPGIGLKPLKECLAEAAPEAFIGITRAHAARAVLGWAADTIRLHVTAGPKLGWPGINLEQLAGLGQRSSGPVMEETGAGEMAALLFTSGSTGIPKGVVYRHRHFVSQVGMLQSAFGIRAGEVDLPTFPPFALFDPALGMTTVIPWMDPTRPAKADPKLLVQSIERFGVTNIFGSPALLRVLGEYTSSRGLKLPRVKRFISAGAAVPIDAIRAMSTALNDDARIFTPYGATECLPVASISSAELDPVVTERTRRGEGICVGKPVDPNRVRILAIKDEAVEEFDDQLLMPTGVAGEIIVNGPTTTDAYWEREEQTRLAKITDDQGAIWHRMGDIGYFDSGDRLWYCGRKSQRIETENGTLFADQVEAVFNTHPEVFRTALVRISEGGKVKPALCVELKGKHGTKRKHRIETDLLQMAGSQTRFSSIAHVFFHPGFPVDIRHNSKINREKLGHWASEQMA